VKENQRYDQELTVKRNSKHWGRRETKTTAEKIENMNNIDPATKTGQTPRYSWNVISSCFL